MSDDSESQQELPPDPSYKAEWAALAASHTSAQLAIIQEEAALKQQEISLKAAFETLKAKQKAMKAAQGLERVLLNEKRLVAYAAIKKAKESDPILLAQKAAKESRRLATEQNRTATLAERNRIREEDYVNEGLPRFLKSIEGYDKEDKATATARFVAKCFYGGNVSDTSPVDTEALMAAIERGIAIGHTTWKKERLEEWVGMLK
jgi:hypothetical protein